MLSYQIETRSRIQRISEALQHRNTLLRLTEMFTAISANNSNQVSIIFAIPLGPGAVYHISCCIFHHQRRRRRSSSPFLLRVFLSSSGDNKEVRFNFVILSTRNELIYSLKVLQTIEAVLSLNNGEQSRYNYRWRGDNSFDTFIRQFI